MMTDPTPKQLAMARRIAKKIANEPDGAYSNEVYLGALAGIIETSERAADLAEGQDAYVASLIRKGDHLDD